VSLDSRARADIGIIDSANRIDNSANFLSANFLANIIVSRSNPGGFHVIIPTGSRRRQRSAAKFLPRMLEPMCKSLIGFTFGIA
jgi:hypothetical protein